MRKKVLVAAFLSFALGANAQWVNKQKDGSYKINTSVLCENVDGYNGPTPVEVIVKNDKIVSVVLLDNDESPKYLRMVEQGLIPKYSGLSVKDVLKQQPDGLTGATYTSKAVKRNVKVALEQYLSEKK